MVAYAPSAIVKRSAVLSTFPWTTDFLLQSQASMPMFACLKSFEAQLEVEDDENAKGIRRGLAILGNGPDVKMPSRMPKLTKPMQTKIFHVVALYRVVDVLNALHSEGYVPGINPRYSRMPEIGVLKSEREWPMGDWVFTLKRARSLLADLRKHEPSQGSTSDPASSLSQDGNLGSKLFRDLHHLAKQHNATKILFNFQLAAIGLYFIFRGTKLQNQLSLPDFPQNVQQIQGGGFDNGDKELLSFVSELMKEYDSHKLRYPLFAALLVSPVVLLKENKLISRCLAQYRLLKVSKALGNCKPDALLKVEFELWKSLRSVAVGQTDAFSAITNLLENVSWDGLKDLSPSDLNFFAPDTVAPSQEFSLLSRANEIGVNECWLLANLRPELSAQSTSHAHDPPLEPQPRPSACDPQQSSAHNPQTQSSAHDHQPSRPSAHDPQQSETHTPGNENEEMLDQDLHSPPTTQSPLLVDLDPYTQAENLLRCSTDFSRKRRAKPWTRPPRTQPPAAQPLQNKGKKRAASDGAAQATAPPKKKNKGDKKELKNHKKMAEPLSGSQTVKGSGSGAYFDPIDVELLMSEREITFEPKDRPFRHRGQEVDLFDPSGQAIQWTPEFHFLEDLTGFQNFHQYVQHFYIGGQPRHVVSPDQSFIAIISHTEYLEMSVDMVQKVLRDKHIIITGTPEQSISFNSKGLQTLTNLDARIDIQDQSIDPENGDHSRQICTGTLRQLLEASDLESGPILNALSFPLPLSGLLPSAMSTEIEAWRLTERMKFCPVELRFPAGEMRWGLAATRGGRSWLRINGDGLGTYIDTHCGGRWWITFNPPSNMNKDAFGANELYLNHFDTNGVNGGRWDLNHMERNEFGEWIAEAVYLSKGSRLIMRPNTPHIVFTTDHSIAHGGHFYATSTLQDTFYAIVHCFIANNLITNNNHMTTRRLLLRMMQYYYKCFVGGVNEDEYSPGHLPDLLDFDSMINILTLCNFCILANVLDFRTYCFPDLSKSDIPSPCDWDQRIRWDRNALSWVDREYYTYVRGLARNLISWICCNYEATSSQSQHPMHSFRTNFCGRYLTEQACAILSYKWQAEEEGLTSLPYCKFNDVERQVDYVFCELLDDHETSLFNDWKDMKAKFRHFTTLASAPKPFIITKKNPPSEFKAMDPVRIGLTQGDEKFREGFGNEFQSAHPNTRSKGTKGDTSTSSESSIDDGYMEE